MRYLRRSFSNLSSSTILLGRSGENNVTQLDIDVSNELSEFPESTFELIFTRPTEDEPYPVYTVSDGSMISYVISGYDLDISGYGNLELIMYGANGQVKKSSTTKTRIESSIIDCNSYPNSVQKWFNLLRQKQVEINSLIENSVPSSEKRLLWDTAAEDAAEAKAAMHRHENGDTLGKLSESEGKLLFDGDPLSDGIAVEDTPSELPAGAEDGSVAVACFGERVASPISLSDVHPPVDIGSPVYNETAINGAIAAQSVGTFVLHFDEDDAMTGGVLPVVSDISENEYVDAGITLDPDATIIATGTKKYAVSILITATSADLIKPTKIVEVDADHVQLPFMAIFTFEDLSAEYSGMGMTLTAGWNVALATIDNATHSEISAIEVVNGVDLNDFVILDTIESAETTGTNAAALFYGLLSRKETRQGGLYIKSGKWQPVSNVQDCVLLSFKEYTSLVVRDDVLDDGIMDVPVYLAPTRDRYTICWLYENGGDKAVSLNVTTQFATNDPVRYLRARINGSDYYYCPVDLYGNIGQLQNPKGWSDINGQPVTPDFSGFTPDRFSVGTDVYTDLASLPADALSALVSLSQCINETASALGHINVPDDSVALYSGNIEPNRKYMYTTGSDIALSLPDVPFTTEDAQFVMYLTCTSDIDLTFPQDTLFVGGTAPNTDAGTHKIIGCWLKDEEIWAVGGIDYEAVNE